MNEKIKCSICRELIKPDMNGWNQGNNAEPVNNGRCCNDCNATVVIPERIDQMRKRNSRLTILNGNNT